ncbi:MAG: 5'-deoxynucleotidase [Oscillospiraceae bacterium]|jgi:5'-deoxynucleotidase|nr:5'-deoxynucleotidase [Oscillospiraceae bacterium]
MASFFSLLSRMKYISRWALMRNAQPENLSEHSLDCALLCHALVVLQNKRFGGELNAERAALLALFHDAPEVLTGDLPTPVKYHSAALRASYGAAEASACKALLQLLPPDLRSAYAPLLEPQEEDAPLWRFVKAADKISALAKCIEERKAGNGEFRAAERATLAALKAMQMPAADCFVREFLPAYEQPIDVMLEG